MLSIKKKIDGTSLAGLHSTLDHAAAARSKQVLQAVCAAQLSGGGPMPLPFTCHTPALPSTGLLRTFPSLVHLLLKGLKKTVTHLNVTSLWLMVTVVRVSSTC